MRHAIRIGVIWVVVSLLVILAIRLLPIPAPASSQEGEGIHQTIYMLFYVGAPIFVFVWVLLLYGIVTFRARPGETAAPAPLPETNTLLGIWAAFTFLVVLFMAGWGSFTLHEITQVPAVAAEGIGEGVKSTPQKNPPQATGVHAGPVKLSGKVLNVQVIGQQWLWTFRYPSYGGMESRSLILPVNTPVLFHVTSLDVVHSFWIYQYDVKEDAVPGVENTIPMLANQEGVSTVNGHDWVTCNELCGLWHSSMQAYLHVTSPSTFASWASSMEAKEKASGLLKNLPAYAPVYFPSSNANWPSAPQDQSP